ncbi:hypothetical protein [Formosa maritima]|uniref:TonB C-terminal domain-containing protein n=1 Tax=Formosa maritima TaxID=2592046 RepID=A0A5D0G2L5_9FLAO|nr:hypothetical protein [Formosa maritima]TYA53065.1 hypothetical protein FVF61_10400 [Formosa maritima]
MKHLYLLFGLLLLVSCNYFDVKKTTSDAILNEELKTFNWSEVDEYPSFASCNDEVSKEEKKRCFQNSLTAIIANKIQRDTIVVSQDVKDTIYIKFQISETGTLSLLEAKVDSVTQNEIPNIDQLIASSLDSLPEIYPAIKRGQQVKTAFTLPVIIQVN